MKINPPHRRPSSALAALICLSAPLAAEALEVRFSADRIRVAQPGFRFIAGPALERLQNGAPVPFAIQLSLSTDRGISVTAHDIQRFVLSYDLWEEHFSVVRVGSNPKRSFRSRDVHAAGAWCIEEMSVAPGSLRDRQNFWVKLEVRLENPAERDSEAETEAISLSRLIDYFSKRTRGEQTRWTAEAGPLRLADLKKSAGEPLPALTLLARLFP